MSPAALDWGEMATQTIHEAERFEVTVADCRVPVLAKGDGPPVVVLHRDTGSPGWLPFYEALAARHRVLVPTHPGFGDADRPEWLRGVRGLAAVYKWLFSVLGLERPRLVGLGFGGWLAAEIAVTSPGACPGLVLVNPMGLRPERGEIVDQFLIGLEEYVRLGFAERASFDAVFGAEPDLDQLVEWEINREMTTRIAWSPYMFDPELPHLLGAIDAPTLVVHGEHDRIVPRDCADQYLARVPGAELRVVEACGHAAEMERPRELADDVIGFLDKRGAA